MRWYFSAWNRLSSSRDVTPTLVRKITMPEMQSYIDMFGCIDGPGEFVDVIQALDNAFVAKLRNIEIDVN